MLMVYDTLVGLRLSISSGQNQPLFCAQLKDKYIEYSLSLPSSPKYKGYKCTAFTNLRIAESVVYIIDLNCKKPFINGGLFQEAVLCPFLNRGRHI